MMLQRCKRCCQKTNAMDVSGVSLEDSVYFVYWISKAKRQIGICKTLDL